MKGTARQRDRRNREDSDYTDTRTIPESAAGYIAVQEHRVAVMRRRVGIISGEFRGCACCPGRVVPPPAPAIRRHFQRVKPVVIPRDHHAHAWRRFPT